MITTDVWKQLLRDYVCDLLRDAAYLKNISKSGDDFAAGQRTAYYDCLDRLRQLTDAFGLDRSEIGIHENKLEEKIL